MVKEEKKKESENEDFNWLQRWVFPVRMNELAKVIPVVILMALALLIYTANRDVKDAVVFQEEGQSIMTIQYCKVIVMLVAIPVVTLFIKLDNMVSRDFIFFQTVLTFGSYFLINGLCLLPYRDAIHQWGSVSIRDIRLTSDQKKFDRLSPLVGTFVFPVCTMNYIISELWGTISISFLVWGYVNLVTPKAAAKRYYAVLGIGAQFGSIAGAAFVDGQSHSNSSFARNMLVMNLVMASLCVVFASVYAFLQYYIMKKPQYMIAQQSNSKSKKNKPKMSVGQAFMYCVKEPYVLALCGMVFSYGFLMVLGEMTYKDLMKLSFDGDSKAYSGFKAKESWICSAVAIGLMVFVGHNILRVFGWLATALLCPIIAGLCASLMYILALSKQVYTYNESANKYRPKADCQSYLEMLRYIGLVFAVCSKAVKYASFDPAKELAYLALTSEQKYKAKAAVDIVGARFGKGGGALFNIIIISVALGKSVSYLQSTLIASFVGVLFGTTLWIISDTYIGFNMAAVTKRSEDLLKQVQDPPTSVTTHIQLAETDSTLKSHAGETQEQDN